MHDAATVRCIECVGNLDAVLHQGGILDRLAADLLVERLAFEQLHRNELFAVVITDFVDGTNVAMVERGCSARLALEPLQSHRLVLEFFG